QFYPASSELVHGLGIVLLGRDTLSPALNLIWLGLALLAAWCIGRPRGCGPLTLLGAALALATMMMDYSQAGSAANDVVGVFLLLAAAALITNSERRLSPLVPACLPGVRASWVRVALTGGRLARTVVVTAAVRQC